MITLLPSSATAYIKDLLSSQGNIVIISHINPDGDALGSMLALNHYLKKQGHHVEMIVPNDYPAFLNWMPGIRDVIIHKRTPAKSNQALSAASVVFCLDFNALKRLDTLEKNVRNRQAPKILIDHHPDPEPDFDIVISQVDTSSTAELVYEIISDLGGHDDITREMAECLYVGIITDTGSLSYSCNNEKTYLIVADLMRRGVDGEQIHTLVYDTNSEERMRLLGYCLSEKLKVLKEYHTAYIVLTKDELRRFKYQIGDSEGIVNYALSITGISFACLIMEREKNIRLSFRSRGKFSVNDFARKHFEGGGHQNAAGGNSFLDLNETVKKFEEILPLYKEELGMTMTLTATLK